MEITERSNGAVQLASDALQILPIMSDIYELAVTLKGREITDSDKQLLYSLTRELRSKASEVGLLPTIEDELRDIDMEIVRDRFARLVKRILPDAQVEAMEAEDK